MTKAGVSFFYFSVPSSFILFHLHHALVVSESNLCAQLRKGTDKQMTILGRIKSMDKQWSVVLQRKEPKVHMKSVAGLLGELGH